MTEAGDGDRTGCLSCDLAHGRRPLPGGLIAEVGGWLVQHCIGPLGVGTLVVVPSRHVKSVADLSTAEAADLGPLLKRSAEVATELCDPRQVYVCLWSHAGGQPGHIHFVVQPATGEAMDRHGGRFGPELQLAMFSGDDLPDPAEVDVFADRARELFASRP
jgi:diadenosine tetraphosphate (Ap4A) HIT family hydrolase